MQYDLIRAHHEPKDLHLPCTDCKLGGVFDILFGQLIVRVTIMNGRNYEAQTWVGLILVRIRTQE